MTERYADGSVPLGKIMGVEAAQHMPSCLRMSKSPKVTTSPAAVRLPIDDKIVDLRKQRVAKLAEILDLESAGAVPREEVREAASIETLALRLLDGEAAPPSSSLSRRDANARLFQFYLDLEVIDRALSIANHRALVDHGERSRQLVAAHREDWRALQKKRAELLIDLLALNRRIEGLKFSMKSGGQFPGIELDDFTARLFGVGRLHNVPGHWAFEFLKAAAKAGLISEKDFRDV
ncbi:hypothetical protein GGD66_000836 [Bradyrhizobium sp. CIR48]|uniref:hypothetical protein n=1 Tax=Bradyrhizobium sp. CIR48 TaxID=2663840 RepID=UPI0016063207|nr:hypothetical protein [Bradyrhizobium sp. CIR48]MBB4422310.1 hypothetical protein [Bradyrhizobium sp. CIR48]